MLFGVRALLSIRAGRIRAARRPQGGNKSGGTKLPLHAHVVPAQSACGHISIAALSILDRLAAFMRSHCSICSSQHQQSTNSISASTPRPPSLDLMWCVFLSSLVFGQSVSTTLRATELKKRVCTARPQNNVAPHSRGLADMAGGTPKSSPPFAGRYHHRLIRGRRRRGK